VDFFTHLFLETSVIWGLFGVFHVQGDFLDSKVGRASFWLVMLGTVAPDFDILVLPAAHRLFTHSLVFPLIFLVVGVVFYVAHRRRLTYTVSWAIALGLLMHFLLDFEGEAPMGLFWPFSPLCFKLAFAVTEGAGGVPQFQFVVLVYTVQQWLTTGGFTMPTGLNQYPFGIPILAFVLYLATVARDFYPWWPCCSQKKPVEPAKQT
jgi:hypothetical protein